MKGYHLVKNKNLLKRADTSFNLITQQDDIDKIYLSAKDLSEPKYEFFIKKCEDAGAKHFGDPNVLSIQILWIAFMRILMITTTQAESV